MHLIDAVGEVKTVFDPIMADMTVGPAPPRIQHLSELSCTFVDLYLHHLDVAFLVEKKRYDVSLNLLSDALSKFGTVVVKRGANSFVALSRKTVALSQLCNIGISRSKADGVLSRLVWLLCEESLDLQPAVDRCVGDLEGEVQDASTPSTFPKETAPSPSVGAHHFGDPTGAVPHYCKPLLFHLQVQGLNFVHHSLTYDFKMMATLRDIMLFDRARVPLLSITNVAKPRLEHFPHLTGPAGGESDEMRIPKPDVTDPYFSHRRNSDVGASYLHRGGNSEHRHHHRPSHAGHDGDARAGAGADRRRSPSKKYGRRRRSISLDREQQQQRRSPRSRRDQSRSFSSSARSPEGRAGAGADGSRRGRRRLPSYKQFASYDEMIATLEKPNYDEYFDLHKHEDCRSMVLVYEEKNVSDQFGEGGHEVGTLYRVLGPQFYDQRDGQLVARGKHVELQLSSLSLLQIVEQMMEAVSQVHAHYSVRKALVRRASVLKQEFHRQVRSKVEMGIFGSVDHRPIGYSPIMRHQANFKERGPQRNPEYPHAYAHPHSQQHRSPRVGHPQPFSSGQQSYLPSRDRKLGTAGEPCEEEDCKHNHIHTYIHRYEIVLSCSVSASAATIVLSYDESYLARISCYSLDCETSDLFNLLNSRRVDLSIESISVLDLSEVGSLHSEVVWRKGDNVPGAAFFRDEEPAHGRHRANARGQEQHHQQHPQGDRRASRSVDPRTPMLSVGLSHVYTGFDGIFEEITLTVKLDAFRACFLYRFAMEVVGYFMNKLIQPFGKFIESMQEIAKRFGPIEQSASNGADDGSDNSNSSFEYSDDSSELFDDTASSRSSDSYLHRANRMNGTAQSDEPENIIGMLGDADSVGTHHSNRRKTTQSFKCSVIITDGALIVPRNSSSRDLIGLTCSHAAVTVTKVREPWAVPSVSNAVHGRPRADESDENLPLHFDIDTNTWRYKPSAAWSRRYATNFPSMARTKSDAPPRRPQPPAEQVRAPTLLERRRSGSVDVREGRRRASDPGIELSHGSGSIDFQAISERSRSSTFAQKMLRAPSTSHLPPELAISTSQDEDDDDDGANRGGAAAHDRAGDNDLSWIDYEEEKNVMRLAIEVEGARAFISLSGPMSTDGVSGSHVPAAAGGGGSGTRERASSAASTQSVPNQSKERQEQQHLIVDTNEHKVFKEIEDNSLVNIFIRKPPGNIGTWAANQAWREITNETFNLLILVDFTDTLVKILFGDTAHMCHASVNVSQAQLYLLMGLWFDNVHECPQFAVEVPSDDDPAAGADGSGTATSGDLADRADLLSGSEKKPKRPVRFSFRLQDTEEENRVPFQPQPPRDRNRVDGEAFNPQGRRRQSDVDRSNILRPSVKTVKTVSMLSKYGSPEYTAFLRNRVNTYEIALIRAEAFVSCSFDSNYFAMPIPSASSLAGMQAMGGGAAHVDASLGISLRSNNVDGNVWEMRQAGYGGGHGPHEARNHQRQYNSGHYVPFSPSSFFDSLAGSTSADIAAGVSNGGSSFAPKRVHNSKWVSRVLPFADIHLSGAFLHVVLDSDVLQMSFGAGKCEIYDTRHPKRTLVPLALRVAPPSDPTTSAHAFANCVQKRKKFAAGGSVDDAPPLGPSAAAAPLRRSYGNSDFDFGFDMVPSDVETPPDTPVKVSLLLSTATNWLTINVGLDMLDLNVESPDLIWLIGDYFSCYYRFTEFGHPGIKAFYALSSPYVIPYGGVDTRVFVSRPHISVLKSALQQHSQALLLETEGGVYYRYVLDTGSNVKQDLNIYDLATVLVKRYRPPSIYRGIRGSSGSGKGVRTLVEFLNLNMSYHLDVKNNHLDLKFDIFSPPLEEDDVLFEENPADAADIAAGANSVAHAATVAAATAEAAVNYVDFDSERLVLKAAAVLYPRCVFPLTPARTDFTTHPTDVVTSYEDLLFCVALVKDFLGIAPASGATDADNEQLNSEYFRDKGSKSAPQMRADAKSATSEDFNASAGSGSYRDQQQSVGEDPTEIFAVLNASGIRVMIVDNVLGLHLPLIQLFVDEVQFTMNRIDPIKAATMASTLHSLTGAPGRPLSQTRTSAHVTRRDSLTQELAKLTSLAQLQLVQAARPDASAAAAGGIASSASASSSAAGDSQGEATGSYLDVMGFGKGVVWAEYFNNMKKCWEPLMEKVVGNVLVEKVSMVHLVVTICYVHFVMVKLLYYCCFYIC